LINDAAIAAMKPGMMLINTSRGAVVDSPAVIRGLKSGQIGALGLDVYEEEADLFFEDLSARYIPDDVFARLLTFPNVLITGHQGFFHPRGTGGDCGSHHRQCHHIPRRRGTAAPGGGPGLRGGLRLRSGRQCFRSDP